MKYSPPTFGAKKKERTREEKKGFGRWSSERSKFFIGRGLCTERSGCGVLLSAASGHKSIRPKACSGAHTQATTVKYIHTRHIKCNAGGRSVARRLLISRAALIGFSSRARAKERPPSNRLRARYQSDVFVCSGKTPAGLFAQPPQIGFADSDI